MAEPPVCPKCGSLAVGERCGACGTKIERPPAGERTSVSIGLDLTNPAIAMPETADTQVGRPPLTGNKQHRQAAAYLALQESEQAVLHAASRIFAAFVANGSVTDANQLELSDRAVKLATRMAVVIEKYIQSDNEDW